MSLRFCDSFDHYATAQMGLKWSLTNASGTTGYAIIQSGGRTANCVKLKSQFLSPNFIQKVIDNQATWILGAAINWTTDSWAMGFFSLYDGSTRQMSLCIDSSGLVYIDKGSSNVATTATSWTNGWNYVEMMVTFNGSSSTVTVKVNGTSLITYTGNLIPSGNNRANIVAIGDYLGAHDGRALLFDDFVAMDGQGSVNNNFIGDITVDALFPNAAGTYSQLTLNGAGTSYGCVNSNPPDVTKYLSSSVSGNRESFTFTGATNSIATVYGVQTVLDSWKPNSGTALVEPFVRVSSTNYDQSSVSLSGTATFYTQVIELNPGTSSAWLSTDISSIQAGIKIV